MKYVNQYGNVEIRNGVPKGYVHMRGERLQPICRKLGIVWAPALIGFEKNRYGCKPILDGVVVSARSAEKVREAIKERVVKLRRTPAPLSMTPENVSRALYIANKHAKSLGSQAAYAYEGGRYKTASKRKRTKDGLYHLKDKVLSKALSDGLATVLAYHSTTSIRIVWERWRDRDDDFDDEEEGQEVEVTRHFRLIQFGAHTFHSPVGRGAITEGAEVVDLGDWQASADIIGKRISLPRAVELLRRYVRQEEDLLRRKETANTSGRTTQLNNNIGN